MNSNLQLATTRNFNGVTFNCYVEQEQQNSGDFYVTREQIGQLLEYSNPRNEVAIIHNRNKERIDKFSGVIKLSTPEGGTQEVTVYNFKGLLEICRYSNQPKADAVMDFLWNIADEIRRTGRYSSKPSHDEIEIRRKEIDTKNRELDIRGAEILQHMIEYPAYPITDESKAILAHEVSKLITGHDNTTMLPVVKEAMYSGLIA